MHMRHPWIEKAVKTFDQADDFDLEFIGASDGTLNRSIEGWRISASREDSNSFHQYVGDLRGAVSVPSRAEVVL